MDWDALGKCIYSWSKWMKQELAGLILTTMSLVFLIRSISNIAFESNHPLLTLIGVTSRPTSFPSINVSTPTGDEPYIKETFITGTEAVKRFRSHLQCFSESGKWVYDPTPRHLPWNYVGDTYASTCEGRHLWSGSDHVANELAEDIALRGTPGNWSVREELKWVWQTNSSCPWQSMNRDDFCRQIASKSNGHVLIVGDSLNHQISWAMLNALAANRSGYTNLDGNIRYLVEPYEMCGDIFGEGNGVYISFVRNDRLSPIVNGTIDTVGNFYEYPWVDLLEKLSSKTLLLNRGAHYEDDEKYTDALHQILTILSLEHPHIHVIYRNTMPGHLDCMNFTEPLSTMQQGVPSSYHWEDFNRQNLLAKKIVEDFHYTYMDVYSMLSIRADGHISEIDCLHYCLPGPIDIAVDYLYNILLIM